MADLKPCPFCGGKAKINARQSGFHGQNFEGNKKISWTIYIKCNKCHSRGKPIKTDPIKLWGDKKYIESGSFYFTEYWLGSGRGLMTATLIFEPYVNMAIEAWNRRAESVKDQPAADVIKIVRCKDCLYVQEKYGHLECINGMSYRNSWNKPDDYCSYGKRKEGDGK